jgi:hypothetical protein
MDMENDPRFFQNNVMDKRLTAIGSLLLISTLVLGCSINLLFGQKKDIFFDRSLICKILGLANLIGFGSLIIVVICCFLAIYVISNQLYHIYRLMTSGPTGIELAGMYYLTPNIVLLRHNAIGALLSGLFAFVFSAGCMLSVKLVRDGGTSQDCFLPVINGTVHRTAAVGGVDYHLIFAVITFAVFAVATAGALYVKSLHRRQFDKFYKMTTSEQSTASISKIFRQMAFKQERLIKSQKHHASVS